MAVEAPVRRIGGSTFARLPPDVVKELGLHDGDTVMLEVTKRGKTIGEILALMQAGTPGHVLPLGPQDLNLEGDRWSRLDDIARRHPD